MMENPDLSLPLGTWPPPIWGLKQPGAVMVAQEKAAAINFYECSCAQIAPGGAARAQKSSVHL